MNNKQYYTHLSKLVYKNKTTHTHVRRIVFITISTFMLSCLNISSIYAQDYNRKELIKSLKTSLKAQKYSQADELLTKAMQQHKEAANDAELCNIHLNTVHHLAESENRKLFLNNKPDTTQYFKQIYRIYNIGLHCDSICSKPDKKGKINTKYTSNIQDKLLLYRNNLKSAGKFYYKKQKYDDAFKYIDMYLKTKDISLITDAHHTSSQNKLNDSDSLGMYQLAVFSAYGAKDYKNAKRYINKALADTTHISLLYQIGSKTYAELGDTIQALDYLYKGWREDPQKEYFYLTLIQYYNNHKQYNEALKIIDEQLDTDSLNIQLWYIKGKCHQCLENYQEAVCSYERAIKINAEDAQSLSSLGNTYILMARRVFEKNTANVGTNEYRKARSQQNKLYNCAKTYLEKARAIVPDTPSLWLTDLSEVYYKLNKGKELKELERIKKKM
ncbi:MAG: hypothetical protein K5874_05670 [Bacteroidaceae bacterium]|nr:hypothetical protein [Bacteroidaceae bacterium]